MVTPLEVLVLGAVEVRGDGGSTVVAGTKLQALVALLALAAPRAVTEDRLIDELWGDRPPAKPLNALQAQVSQLRRLVGRDAITFGPSGYAFDIAPDNVDAIRLEHLVERGRVAADDGDHHQAAKQFGAAVALLRGPPLGQLVDHPFAVADAARLQDLVLHAHEGFVDAELSLGHHVDVVTLLSDLVGAHPLWERFHAQLMISLYRCGRQSEALRAYAHVRHTLAEEMGLDPGPELQALERAVLSHDPALASPIRLASISQHRSLPTSLTSFVGRTTELETLLSVVDESRLVSVLGPAGVGKTRLALEAAHRLAAAAEVRFVELAPVTDPVAVPEAVCAAIGALDHAPSAAGTGPRPPDVRAIERIGDRSVIAVIDNCEHVVDEVADFIGRLLGGCPALTVIATSRQSLGIDGERQLTLAPLAESDAVALFADRAEAVQPRFRDGGGQDDDVAELCRRLDLLPLAIELAAARTKTLPVAEITSRLDDRFGLLVGGRRPSAGRHNGLRDAVDWSYDLLFGDDRTAFRRLAVFAGGVTIEGALEVCGPDALDIVSRLVDKSLLVADTSGRVARFRMLETLRAYGIDRLKEAGELDEALIAHREFCVRLAEAAAQAVRGIDQLVWLQRLDAEHDNLRAALAHSAATEPSAGLALIGPLILPWWFRGRGQEARHWLEACLAGAGDVPVRGEVTALTWSALLADFGGWVDRPGGFEDEMDLADRRQQRAIVLAEAAGDVSARAYAQTMRSLTLARRTLAGVAADASDLSALLDDARTAFGAVGDVFGSGFVDLIDAIFRLATGDLAAASIAIEAARGHAERGGDRFTRGRVEWVSGLLAQTAGDASRAYRHVERGLRLLDEVGMTREVTAQAGLLVALAEQSGQEELAEQWRAFVAGRSGGLARHDMLMMASARNGEGLNARRDGFVKQARDAHHEALAIYTDVKVSAGIAYSQACLGFLAAGEGEPDVALVHFEAALDAANSSGQAASLAFAVEGLAALRATDQPDHAAILLGAASTLWGAASIGERSHRDDIGAAADRARLVLGDDAFAAAFATGTAMTPAEAVAIGSGAGQ